MEERNPRPLQNFLGDIDALEKATKGLGHKVAAAFGDRSVLGFQAEWHIRGVLYHLRRVAEHHHTFVIEVCARAGAGASVLYMYAPSYQEMLFEFYALVNLCRISLDNIRIYLRPLFTRKSDQLRKSVRDVLKGTTNCPVYLFLTGQPLVDYLLDLRNCLVHYRSFATSDNAYVIEEGSESAETLTDNNAYMAAMAKADFRRVGENGISVNVLLPDHIFDPNDKNGTRLAVFTYNERYSLISTARNFAQLSILALADTLRLLAEIPDPVFEFSGGKHTA